MLKSIDWLYSKKKNCDRTLKNVFNTHQQNI